MHPLLSFQSEETLRSIEELGEKFSVSADDP